MMWRLPEKRLTGRKEGSPTIHATDPRKNDSSLPHYYRHAGLVHRSQIVEDRDTIRQKTVAIIQDLLKEEEGVDGEVHKKISSQKKEILEGSEEWDVLYRKYYADEMRRMGIVHQVSS